VNIPNSLTLGRIVLVPLIVWLIITHEMTAAFALFLLAGLFAEDYPRLPSAKTAITTGCVTQ
jgi:hypothetical protein